MRSDSGVALELPDVSAYLALTGNPFMWKGEIPEGPPPTAGEREDPVEPPVKPPVKPTPPKPTPPAPIPPVPPTPSVPQWKLPVAYVGTVQVQGGGRPRAAIFKDKETGEHMRLTKGDEYKEVKLVEVKSNSVILLNKEGKRFVLPQR